MSSAVSLLRVDYECRLSDLVKIRKAISDGKNKKLMVMVVVLAVMFSLDSLLRGNYKRRVDALVGVINGLSLFPNTVLKLILFV